MFAGLQRTLMPRNGQWRISRPTHSGSLGLHHWLHCPGICSSICPAKEERTFMVWTWHCLSLALCHHTSRINLNFFFFYTYILRCVRSMTGIVLGLILTFNCAPREQTNEKREELKKNGDFSHTKIGLWLLHCNTRQNPNKRYFFYIFIEMMSVANYLHISSLIKLASGQLGVNRMSESSGLFSYRPTC